MTFVELLDAAGMAGVQQSDEVIVEGEGTTIVAVRLETEATGKPKKKTKKQLEAEGLQPTPVAPRHVVLVLGTPDTTVSDED